MYKFLSFNYTPSRAPRFQVALRALRVGRNDLDAAWQYLENLWQRKVGIDAYVEGHGVSVMFVFASARFVLSCSGRCGRQEAQSYWFSVSGSGLSARLPALFEHTVAVRRQYRVSRKGVRTHNRGQVAETPTSAEPDVL